MGRAFTRICSGAFYQSQPVDGLCEDIDCNLNARDVFICLKSDNGAAVTCQQPVCVHFYTACQLARYDIEFAELGFDTHDIFVFIAVGVTVRRSLLRACYEAGEGHLLG